MQNNYLPNLYPDYFNGKLVKAHKDLEFASMEYYKSIARKEYATEEYNFYLSLKRVAQGESTVIETDITDWGLLVNAIDNSGLPTIFNVGYQYKAYGGPYSCDDNHHYYEITFTKKE